MGKRWRSDESVGSGKRARKGNPFAVPDSSYHLGVFKAVEPFVTVWEKEGSLRALGVKNKFCGGLMSNPTLELVVQILAERLVAVEDIYTQQKTEGNMGPWHLALVELFYWLSAPSNEDMEKLRESFRRSRNTAALQMLDNLNAEGAEFEGFNLEVGVNRSYLLNTSGQGGEDCHEMHTGQGGQGGQHRGHEQGSGKEQASGSSSSSGEGFSLGNEEPPVNEFGLPENARTDIKLWLHKPSVFNDPKLRNRCVNELKAEFSPFIAECKAKDDERAIFQNAGYGRTQVRQNIAHGHMDPLYLPVLSGSRFTYAILDVHGLVTVDRNAITEAAYEQYTEYCKEKGVRPRSISNLIDSLEAGVKELKLWDDGHIDTYPKDQYIVGDLYVSDEWYPLPSGDIGYASDSSLFYIESMLRVVVGDKVLSWTPDDVRKVFWRRQNYVRVKALKGGVPPFEEYGHVPPSVLMARFHKSHANLLDRLSEERLLELKREAENRLRSLSSSKVLEIMMLTQEEEIEKLMVTL